MYSPQGSSSPQRGAYSSHDADSTDFYTYPPRDKANLPAIVTSPTQKITFASGRDPGPAHRHQSPLDDRTKQLRIVDLKDSAFTSPPRNRPESDYSLPQHARQRLHPHDAGAGHIEGGGADRERLYAHVPGGLDRDPPTISTPKPHDNLTGGFLYSSPRTQKMASMSPHTSRGSYSPLKSKEDGNIDSPPPSKRMLSMYNPLSRALDAPLTGKDALRRQYASEGSAAYQAALVGNVNSAAIAKQSGEFSITDAAIGHSNALALREELRLDLQQLDLLVSDIAHFRQGHAGAEIQRLKQRRSTINQWCHAFQQWFTDKGADIMKKAEIIRREQETLSKDTREQFLLAQVSVEGLEKQVNELSSKLQEDISRYEVKLASIKQRKERLERQIRSLESKRDTDIALNKRAIADGEKDIEEMTKVVTMFQREIAAKQAEARVQDDICRERYMMLLSDSEVQRQRVVQDIKRGMWETRFIRLLDKQVKKDDHILNPVRNMKREYAWDEIENLEADLRAMQKSDDPLRSALVQVADAEVGAAKSNLIQLRKLYDQTMIVRKLNFGVAHTFTALSLRHPELFQKDPHELKEYFEALAVKNTTQLDLDRGRIDANDPNACAPSAKNDQEKFRYRQKTLLKPPASKKLDAEVDISFIQNPNKRFDRGGLIDGVPVDVLIADIHGPSREVCGIPPSTHWVDFPPKPNEPNDGSNRWATFGDPWLDD
eukprot:GEMP01011161.1.p1 GENE.GEMP01011161.1~~GEMP01011161.1.p1  ORF type:complete len:715 (+),score=162.76 GEMP01011161.1:317-2461(+)